MESHPLNTRAESSAPLLCGYCFYFSLSRCAITLCSASSSDPRNTSIFTSRIADPPGANVACGSTCWHVSSGLLHTLPVVRVKLATTHLPSVESVATIGWSTARDLL